MTKQMIHFYLNEPRFEGVVLVAKLALTGAVLAFCGLSLISIAQIVGG